MKKWNIPLEEFSSFEWSLKLSLTTFVTSPFLREFVSKDINGFRIQFSQMLSFFFSVW